MDYGKMQSVKIVLDGSCHSMTCHLSVTIYSKVSFASISKYLTNMNYFFNSCLLFVVVT